MNIEVVNQVILLIVGLLGITALIIGIILGLKTIKIVDKVDATIDDINDKIQSLNMFFNGMNFISDKLSFISDYLTDKVLSLFNKIFKRKQKKEKEINDYE